MRSNLSVGLLIICMLFLSESLFAQSPRVLLVSDIDDTIKVSHVLSNIGKISRAADVTTPFMGMAALYQLIINQNPASTKVIYLSNAPEELAGIPALKYSHQTFLSLNHFPPGQLLLREDIFEKNHKIKVLRQLIDQESPDVLIMVGDNGEKDAEIYHQIVTEYSYSKMQMHTFIHQLYSSQNSFLVPDFLEEIGKPLFPEQNGYVTPIEIGLKLNEQKLFNTSSVEWLIQRLAPAIVAEKRFKWDGLKALTFPQFMNCSDFKWKMPTPQSLLNLLQKIESECN